MERTTRLQLVRRLGFGLAPNEELPTDVTAWAQAQMDSAPPMQFHQPLDAASQSKVPPAGMDLLESAQEGMRKVLLDHSLRMKRVRAQTKTLDRAAWDQLWWEQVSYPIFQFEPWKEIYARANMAVYGVAPVFERFWHFWTNHFTVGEENNNVFVQGPYLRMLRKNMQGNFRDMLFGAVTHPAMLLYLDNSRSSGPKSVAVQQGRTKQGLNENLGREMLELFSVSPAANYTQDDVVNTALILTGWSVDWEDEVVKTGKAQGTVFRYNHHEPGAQRVMGKEYSAFLHHDSKLKDLVTDLAAHPMTAQHLARKLATVFIDDSPPVDSIDRIQAVFLASGGHLPTVHKAVIEEAARHIGQTRKFQNPESWLWTIHRITGCPLPAAVPHRDIKGIKLHNLLADLGQALAQVPQPNGWPITARDWLSFEALDRRVRYGVEFARQHRLAFDALGVLAAKQGLETSSAWQRISQAKGRKTVGDERELWANFLASPELMWS